MRVQLNPVVQGLPNGVRIAVLAEDGVAALLYATTDGPVEQCCADTSAAINAALRPVQQKQSAAGYTPTILDRYLFG